MVLDTLSELMAYYKEENAKEASEEWDRERLV